jgi:hypothetical protein
MKTGMEMDRERLDAFLNAKGFNKYDATYVGFEEAQAAISQQAFGKFSVSPADRHPLATMHSEGTVQCCMSGVNPILMDSLNPQASGVGVGFTVREDGEVSLEKAYPTLWVKTSYCDLYWRQESKESIRELRYQDAGAEFPTGEILHNVYLSIRDDD